MGAHINQVNFSSIYFSQTTEQPEESTVGTLGRASVKEDKQIDVTACCVEIFPSRRAKNLQLPHAMASAQFDEFGSVLLKNCQHLNTSYHAQRSLPTAAINRRKKRRSGIGKLPKARAVCAA